MDNHVSGHLFRSNTLNTLLNLFRSYILDTLLILFRFYLRAQALNVMHNEIKTTGIEPFNL